MSDFIQNVLERTVGDGARSTKFEALFTFTDINNQLTKEEQLAMCKTASFPSKSHTTIDLKYKGRSIPIKGQTKYTQEWECTFYLTEDHKLKKAFENWIEALDQKHNYLDVTESTVLPGLQKQHLRGYATDISVIQRNFTDERNTAQYTLHNAFPITISEVATSYESRGEILEFSVTFAYSHFTSKVMTGKDGNFVDEIAGKAKDAASQQIKRSLGYIGDHINSFVGENVAPTLDALNSYASGKSVGGVSKMAKTIFDVVGR